MNVGVEDVFTNFRISGLLNFSRLALGLVRFLGPFRPAFNNGSEPSAPRAPPIATRPCAETLMGVFGGVKAAQETRVQANRLTAEELSPDADLTEAEHHAAPIRRPPETELRAEAGEEQNLVQLALDVRNDAVH